MLITLKTDIRPPTAPVLGSPTSISTTSITVPLLTAATDPSGVASYTLEYATSLNGSYVEATAAAVFPQTVTGLTPSTEYFFRARAVDSYGNAGPYSGIVSATTQDVAPIPGLSWPAHVPAYLSLIPGIGGYGMNTVAGSGRHLATPATTVILVNTLAAGNTGSAATGLGTNVFQGTWEYAWRHAASPKVIIPIVSGWVTVQDSIPCQTGTPPRPGYVSYYGQFAPNPGLFLRGANVVLNGASNVAVWHLRSYMGDDVTGLGAGNRDCMSSGYGTGTTQQVCFINCECAWSVDELVDLYRSHNQVSLVNCAFIEPLHVSTIVHPEDGPGVDHGFGPIVGGDTGNATQTSTVSAFRNLWAHTTGRNPLISCQTYVHANNLHYNHGRPTGGAGNGVQLIGAGATAPNFANILGNGFVRGPNNNTSMVSVTAASTLPAGSAGYSFANCQFGWTAPANQSAFFTSSPSGYVASTVQTDAYPNSWGTGVDGVLQWASNPLAPTLTEWSNFVTLMDRTVGAQPRWRTTQYGRVAQMFQQIRDRLNGVTQTDQFVDTVAEAGGWFTVPSVTIDPLNPGSHWRAPLPTGSDRDTPYTSGTFSDGKSRIGYTRLEEWAYEQHLYVTSFDTVAPSIPLSVTAQALSQTAIRTAWAASTDTGGAGLAGYKIYRATTSTGSYTLIGTVSVSALSFDDTTLSAGTTRYYRITAFDAAGNESNASSTVSATTYTATITRLPLTDSFENGLLTAWDIVGGTVTVLTVEHYGSGTRSASTLATAGQQSDNYLEYNFGDAPSVGGTPTGMNDLWIQFAHKWDSAYVDSDPNIPGQKLLLLNSQNPSTGRRRYQFTFNLAPGGSQYYVDIYRWNEDTSFNSTIHNITVPFARVLGRWEEFVFRIRQNTPGATDGQLDCWIKAQGESAYTQYLNRTNLNFRDNTSFTPNRLIGLSNYDTYTTRSGRRYWDSFYIGQDPVNVSASTGGNVGQVGTYAALNLSTFPVYSVDMAQRDYQLFATQANPFPVDTQGGIAGSGSQQHFTSGWPVGGGAYCRITPPTTNQYERGINLSNLHRNGTLGIQEFNLRFEIRYGPTIASAYQQQNNGCKHALIQWAPTVGGAGNTTGRPVFFIQPTTVADGALYRRNNTMAMAPAANTLPAYGNAVYDERGTDDNPPGTNTYYCNGPQAFYLIDQADAGTTFNGVTMFKCGEVITVEYRLISIATAQYPRGLIAMRMTNSAGVMYERGIPWDYKGNFAMGQFLSEVQQFGCGQFNVALPAGAGVYFDIGGYITVARNFGGWLGPRQ